MSGRSVAKRSLIVVALASSVAWGATVYDPGTASSAGLAFGTMQIGGTHPSVWGGGVGGPHEFSATGNILDGSGDAGRVYMYDPDGLGALATGASHRSDGGFAMMIWDMGQSVNGVRVYPMQDHLTPAGPNVDEFGNNEVIEYSVWGSNNGDDFVLLCDVTAATLGLNPTFTFAGSDPPTRIYLGGSEFGKVNSHTLDFSLSAAYRYIGIRGSTVGILYAQGDQEIDAVASFSSPPAGGGDGYTPGFWHNKNGQAAINAANSSIFTLLDGLCLFNENGSDFDPATAGDIKGWITSDATNMAFKLSTMLACMELNVNVPVNGKTVDPNRMVYTGDCATELGVSQISIADLMAQANADLCTPGHNITIASGDVRKHQKCLKDVLDRANNNLNWVP